MTAPAALGAALEAMLVASDRPLDPAEVADALDREPAEVAAELTTLAADYENAGRGFRLRETAGGWRLFAAPEHTDVLRSLAQHAAPARLSSAALETLAVVAYQQPVSRGRIAAVRGVDVDAVMRTLVARGLVTEVGEDPASGALLYGTTPLFLDKLGLRSLGELPPLADHLPDDAALLELIEQVATRE